MLENLLKEFGIEMYMKAKEFALIDWFYDYFDAEFCSDQNQGSVIYFFYSQPPELLYE